MKGNWLAEHKRIITSQHGEDGIIEELFKVIGTTNKWCVEFGAWDGKYNSNTWNLIVNHGWQAVEIEMEPARVKTMRETYKNYPVECLQRHIGLKCPDTLDEILSSTDVPHQFDFLSIDVDGIDRQIWESLSNYKPRVVCIECCPEDERKGSPLSAMVELGIKKGYSLVATLAVNAFFVEHDLFSLFEIDDNSLMQYPIWRKQ